MGVPLIHNGRTRGVAWGLTNNVSSNRDLYAEEPNPANPDEVRDGDGWARLDSREEVIKVRGAEPVRLTVRTSPRGPIVNHLIPSVEPGGDPPIALRWVGLDPRDCITGGLELARAQSCAEARETHRALAVLRPEPRLRRHGRPHRLPDADSLPDQRGRIPAASARRPTRTTSGRSRSPSTSLPAEADPERGWIGSSNQRPHPDRQRSAALRLVRRWLPRAPDAVALDVCSRHGPRACRSSRRSPWTIWARCTTTSTRSAPPS